MYRFSLWQVGASFFGISVSMVAAILADRMWWKNYIRLEKTFEETSGDKGEFIPNADCLLIHCYLPR